MRFLRVIVAVVLVTLVPANVGADTDLTQAVARVFFPRIESAYLHDLAHQRAAYQASVDDGTCLYITHEGMVEAEVIACNIGFTDPATQAVIQWFGSSLHFNLLNDRLWTHIGCAGLQDGLTYYAVCTLDDPPGAVLPIPPTPAPAPVPTPVPGPILVPSPAETTLPNTVTDP